MKISGFKRRKFLINPKFQNSIIQQMMILAVAIIVIFYCANLYHFWTLKQQGQALGLPADHIFFWFVEDQSKKMDLIFLTTSICSFLTIFFYGLVVSHRVAGPMYRIREYLLSATKTADLPVLKLRDKDYFHDVAEAINIRLKDKKDS